MTKSEIIASLARVPDDTEVRVCLHPEIDPSDLDDLEGGSLLDIVDAGYVARTHVLYVKPV